MTYVQNVQFSVQNEGFYALKGDYCFSWKAFLKSEIQFNMTKNSVKPGDFQSKSKVFQFNLYLMGLRQIIA